MVKIDPFLDTPDHLRSEDTGNSSWSGTVTEIDTDSTLTGWPITTTGTLWINLSHANTWIASQTIKKDNIITTTTDFLIGENTTAATSMVPVQISPAIELLGSSWKTGSGATAITTWIRFYEKSNSASGILSSLHFDGIDNGIYVDDIAILSASWLTLSWSLIATEWHFNNWNLFIWPAGNQVILSSDPSVSSYSLLLPLDQWVANSVMVNDGSWNLTWELAGTGTIGWSIAANQIAFWTWADTIGGASFNRFEYTAASDIFSMLDVLWNQALLVDGGAWIVQLGWFTNNTYIIGDDSAMTFTFVATNGILIPALGGGWNQMVKVDNFGQLGVQAIPTWTIGWSISTGQVAWGSSPNVIWWSANFLFDNWSGILSVWFWGTNNISINPTTQTYIFGNNTSWNDLYIDEGNQFTQLNVASWQLIYLDPINTHNYYFGDSASTFNNSYLQIQDTTTALWILRLNTVDALFMSNATGDYYFGDPFGAVDSTYLHLALGSGIAEINANSEFRYTSNWQSFLDINPGTSTYSFWDISNSIDGNAMMFSNPGGNGSLLITLNGITIVQSIAIWGNAVVEVWTAFWGNHTHAEIDDISKTIKLIANESIWITNSSSTSYISVSTSTNVITIGSVWAPDINLVVPWDIIAPGSIGPVTINKMSWRVNIGAGVTSYTVTNSLVTADSHIFFSTGVDAFMTYPQYTPTTWSFTITLQIAPVAETPVDFFVINNF